MFHIHAGRWMAIAVAMGRFVSGSIRDSAVSYARCEEEEVAQDAQELDSTVGRIFKGDSGRCPNAKTLDKFSTGSLGTR